jgi:hypothetical protein
MFTVTFGGPIKKYAQTTPSADGVSSIFQVLIDYTIYFGSNFFGQNLSSKERKPLLYKDFLLNPSIHYI